MNPVALITMTLFVYSESFCTRTLNVEKRLKDIEDKGLKKLLKHQVHDIKGSDCIRTFQVTPDDEEFPFYPFLIERQQVMADDARGIFTISLEYSDRDNRKNGVTKTYGVVHMSNNDGLQKNYTWQEWNSSLFATYEKSCLLESKSDRFKLLSPPERVCRKS